MISIIRKQLHSPLIFFHDSLQPSKYLFTKLHYNLKFIFDINFYFIQTVQRSIGGFKMVIESKLKSFHNNPSMIPNLFSLPSDSAYGLAPLGLANGDVGQK